MVLTRIFLYVFISFLCPRFSTIRIVFTNPSACCLKKKNWGGKIILDLCYWGIFWSVFARGESVFWYRSGLFFFFYGFGYVFDSCWPMFQLQTGCLVLYVDLLDIWLTSYWQSIVNFLTETRELWSLHVNPPCAASERVEHELLEL